ncbi:hypothetical protein ASD24_23855 [Paenibacillus sp. Root52]|uniref:Lipoprotein n=1 Tax=Paenibacillus amylolyticus TaxID=1451 RepID=A0AAP5H6C9_PAEAM|nr:MULTISPECIES: hypothetical protein [Paenibacillus]KQY91154.1 hypothetical protein ASD24_23855 [Paenibacillus sp. Root52]MDR6725563.1 hypothetical protein [Paenibacillus amylolyticus]
MRKVASILVLLFLATGMAACNDLNREGSSSAEQSKEKVQSETVSAQQVTESEDSETNFEQGVFIDWEQVHDPLLNDEIREVLQEALDANVRSDQSAFRSLFLEPEVADRHWGQFGGNVRYTEIGHVSKDTTKNHILVSVLGEIMRDTHDVEEYAITYYFAKDEEGKWGLVAVD